MGRVMAERGQMTMEMMLIVAITVGIGLTIVQTAKSQGWMQDLVEGPWKPLQAMIEDGTWNTKNSKAYNPGMTARHATFQPDPVP